MMRTLKTNWIPSMTDVLEEEFIPSELLYSHDPIRKKVSVYKRLPEARIELVAEDLSTVDNAKLFMKAFVDAEKNEYDARTEALRAFRESLKKPHQFLNSYSSDTVSVCRCGKEAGDDIHYIKTKPHVYSPAGFVPQSVNGEPLTTGTMLCQCGHTKNDPRHIEEGDL